MSLTGSKILEILTMEPLEPEGGYIRQTLRDERQSVIYYLLIAPAYSAMHKLSTTEIWHYYGGAPLEMLILGPDGSADQPLLGMDLESGQRPQLVVPGGCWQGARSTAGWTLVGTTMSPS